MVLLLHFFHILLLEDRLVEVQRWQPFLFQRLRSLSSSIAIDMVRQQLRL